MIEMHTRRHGVAHEATARVAKSGTEKAQAFKVQQGRTYWLPGFEAISRGSWWDVDIVEKRDTYYLAKFLSASAEEDESWLPLHHLRLRTRKADDWDCHILKRGMDISVFSHHPDHEDLGLHPKALYDARITQLSKVAHDVKCKCMFHVKFYCISEGDSSKGRTNSSAIREIHISKVSILQKPVNLTFEEILRSHMFEKWLPIKWANDAYYLRETKPSNGNDDEDDDLEVTLPAFVATRTDKVEDSSRPTKGSTSIVHETDRSPASEGKAHAYVREIFDQKHKHNAAFSKAQNVVRGLKQDGQFEPGARANDDVFPEGFKQLDVDFDQHRDRPSGGGGGEGRKYEEIQKETDDIGANGRGQLYAERLVKAGPDYLDSVADCLDSVLRARRRRNVLDVEVKGKFVHQNRAKQSPELLVRGVKAAGDDVPGHLRIVQDPVFHQTGKSNVSLHKDEETRKQHSSQVVFDSEDSDHDSEDMVAYSVSSDESSFDAQTHGRKRTRFQRSRNQDPGVRVRLSRHDDEQLGRSKSIPRRNKRRGETDIEIDRVKEDSDLEALGAEELQFDGKLPSELKAQKVSPPKIVDKTFAGRTSEHKHPDAEKSSPTGRKRGRPKKTVIEQPKPSGKPGEKNTASPAPPKDASPKKRAALEAKNGKSPDPKVEKSPKSKGSNLKREVSLKPKACVVIDLEDDLCSVLEGYPNFKKEGTVAERRSGLRVKSKRECIHGNKAVLKSKIECIDGNKAVLKSKRECIDGNKAILKSDREGVDGNTAVFDTHRSEAPAAEQEDVALKARLRSYNVVKKNHSTAPSSSAPKTSKAKGDTGVQNFAQRPLYLDLLGENPEEETQVENQNKNQVEVGASGEIQSHEPGGDLDLSLDELIITGGRQSAPTLEKKQAVDPQNQRTKASDVDCQVPDPDSGFGSVSAADVGVETGGEVDVGDIPADVTTENVGEALNDQSSGGEGCKVVEEASTVLDSTDKIKGLPDYVQERCSEVGIHRGIARL